MVMTLREFTLIKYLKKELKRHKLWGCLEYLVYVIEYIIQFIFYY